MCCTFVFIKMNPIVCSRVGSFRMQTFCTYSAFKAHFFRVHNVLAPSNTARAVVTDLKCAISIFECQFQTLKELVSHLEEHIMEGQPVACPLFDCKNTFTTHMSKKHRACSINSISDIYRETISQPSVVTACEDASQRTKDTAAEPIK